MDIEINFFGKKPNEFEVKAILSLINNENISFVHNIECIKLVDSNNVFGIFINQLHPNDKLLYKNYDDLNRIIRDLKLNKILNVL